MSTDLGMTYRVLQRRPRPERIALLPRVFLRHFTLARRYASLPAALRIAWDMAGGLAIQHEGEPPGFWEYLPVVGLWLTMPAWLVRQWKTDYFGKLLGGLLLLGLLSAVIAVLILAGVS